MPDSLPVHRTEKRMWTNVFSRIGISSTILFCLLLGCGGPPAGPGESPPAAPETATAEPAAAASAPADF
jgi:hypothetical protein